MIACLALTPALWLNGGLKTRFHMDESAIETADTHVRTMNLELQTESRKIHNSNLIDSNEMTTMKPLHHSHNHHHHHRHRGGKVERDVDQMEFIDSDQIAINPTNVEESVESLIINGGTIRKITQKQVIDFTNGNEQDEIEIIDEIAAEPISNVVNERILEVEPKARIKERMSSTHRTHAVFSENSLIFDCTRFWGFDFAAAVGKSNFMNFNLK